MDLEGLHVKNKCKKIAHILFMTMKLFTNCYHCCIQTYHQFDMFVNCVILDICQDVYFCITYVIGMGGYE